MILSEEVARDTADQRLGRRRSCARQGYTLLEGSGRTCGPGDGSRSAWEACCSSPRRPATGSPPEAPTSSRKAPAWLTERPIAHRGLHTGDSRVPENSLAAFQAAADAGYAIELDVQLTSDGQLVVCHDDDLTRMTGTAKKISETSVRSHRAAADGLDADRAHTGAGAGDRRRARSRAAWRSRTKARSGGSRTRSAKRALGGERARRGHLLQPVLTSSHRPDGAGRAARPGLVVVQGRQPVLREEDRAQPDAA